MTAAPKSLLLTICTLMLASVVSAQSHRNAKGDNTDGTVLNVERRTANDSYSVFTEDPSKGGQTTQAGPLPSPGAPSPAGWLFSGAQSTININGNNVSTYLDSSNNNQPDKGGTTVTNGNFLTGVDFTVQPTTTGNKNVAVQNLFYLNNVIHDILYSHGFTEAVGNFQVDNFGKGGKDGDPVMPRPRTAAGPTTRTSLHR